MSKDNSTAIHYESVRQLVITTRELINAIKKNEAEILDEPSMLDMLEGIHQTTTGYLVEELGYPDFVMIPLLDAFGYWWMRAEEYPELIGSQFRAFKYACSELFKNW